MRVPGVNRHKKKSHNKEHQVFFSCRREIELLKKEMEECGYTGKIVLIEPCVYKDETRIRVVVEQGTDYNNWGSWLNIVQRVRLQTTQRRYSTDEVLTALEDAGLGLDKIDAVMSKLYPEYLDDKEDIEDWVDEPWFKEACERTAEAEINKEG